MSSNHKDDPPLALTPEGEARVRADAQRRQWLDYFDNPAAIPPGKHAWNDSDVYPKSAVKLVKLADLREREPGVWEERERDNADTLERYAASMKAGDKFPSITVMEKHDGALVILNGNHRVLAARRIDPNGTIEARVYPVPAQWDSEAYRAWLGAAMPPTEWLDYFRDPTAIPPGYPEMEDIDHDGAGTADGPQSGGDREEEA